MTATTDYDARLLNSVRRAVVGLTIDDWGDNAWEFNHRVRAASQLALLDMSRTDQAVLSETPGDKTYLEVLYTVEGRIGVPDKALAHLIVLMHGMLA